MARINTLLSTIKCNNETSDGGSSDEPYLITCTILRIFSPADCKDLDHLTTALVELRLFTIPGGNVDAGETFNTTRINAFEFFDTSQPIVSKNTFELHKEFSFGGTGRTQFDPNELIIISMLLENDDSSESKILKKCETQIRSLLFNNGKPTGNFILPHLELEALIIKNLKSAFNSAKDTAWYHNDDDLINVKRLAISADQTKKAINRTPQTLIQELVGGDGKYTITYKLSGEPI